MSAATLIVISLAILSQVRADERTYIDTVDVTVHSSDQSIIEGAEVNASTSSRRRLTAPATDRNGATKISGLSPEDGMVTVRAVAKGVSSDGVKRRWQLRPVDATIERSVKTSSSIRPANAVACATYGQCPPCSCCSCDPPMCCEQVAQCYGQCYQSQPAYEVSYAPIYLQPEMVAVPSYEVSAPVADSGSGGWLDW